MNGTAARRRTIRALVAVALVYAALVGTHAGEFWPFSIYQMFSQAGQPWTRVVVHELPEGQRPVWQPAALADAPGDVFALSDYGLRANDLASLVQDPVANTDLDALHRALAPYALARPLIVFRALGRRGDAEGVDVQLRPFAVVHPDTLLLAPNVSVPLR